MTDERDFEQGFGLCFVRSGHAGRKQLGATVFQLIPELTSQYLRSIAICMPIGYHMCMKRTALFLKEEQLKKLQTLSEKTGAPVAELIRRAVDRYLKERAKELK